MLKKKIIDVDLHRLSVPIVTLLDLNMKINYSCFDFFK